MYSKGGGKNGKYGWVPKVDSITAASYIPVQVYEHTIGRKFCATTQAALLRGRKKSYAFVQPTAFLCSTRSLPKAITADLEASVEDMQDFRALLAVNAAVRGVVEKLRKAPRRKRGGEPGGQADEDEDDE